MKTFVISIVALLAVGCSIDDPKLEREPSRLIDLGASNPVQPSATVADSIPPGVATAASGDDPLCQEIIFYTKIPECPPCVAMHKDGFEFEVATTFGCRIGKFDEELLSGMPYLVVVMNDGARVECHEVYQPKLETRADRLKYLVAKVAKTIEDHEVKR